MFAQVTLGVELLFVPRVRVEYEGRRYWVKLPWWMSGSNFPSIGSYIKVEADGVGTDGKPQGLVYVKN